MCAKFRARQFIVRLRSLTAVVVRFLHSFFHKPMFYSLQIAEERKMSNCVCQPF
jgi:hypothetical protein